MEELHINGKYRHKKGKEYLAKGIVDENQLTQENKKNLRYKGIAKHSETLETYSIYEIREGIYLAINTFSGEILTDKFVLYMALYGNNQLWIRPYEMFMEEERFKFIGIL